LEDELALASGEERLDQGNQIGRETPLLARILASLFAQTLSKPPLTSRKRVDTLKEAAWSRRSSWVRVATASKQPRPAREPD